MEDNKTDVLVIREALQQCGFEYDLCVAEDGQDALRCIDEYADRKQCPTLVLLDLNLPKIDGMEVLKRLRKHWRCSHSLVIVVTSSDSATDRATAKRLGANAYFRKPMDLSEYMRLSDVIRSVLGYGPAGAAGLS